ncbi:hypothetical protein CFC21_048188, partial [Triticum aestivum]
MELTEAARDEAAFAMRVLRHLACGGGKASASGANLAVSPLSIHAALALLGAGARGATLDQVVAFLGPAGGPAHAALASHVALRLLSDSPGDDGGPSVRFANGVWVDAAMRLKVDYAALVSEHYRAQALPASFKDMPEEARTQINRWFESATAGRIKGLLPEGSVNGATLAVLGNALYFKGAWCRKFDPRLTLDDTFHLPAGGSVRAPFMSSRDRQQHVACRSGYKVLQAAVRARPRAPVLFHVHLPPGRARRPAEPAAQAGVRPGAAGELHDADGPGPRGRLQGAQVHHLVQDERDRAAAGPRPAPAVRAPRRGLLGDAGFGGAARRVGRLPPVLRRGERGRDGGGRGDRRCCVLWRRGGEDAGSGRGLRGRPPVHVLDQGGAQRRRGFLRPSGQSVGSM